MRTKPAMLEDGILSIPYLRVVSKDRMCGFCQWFKSQETECKELFHALQRKNVEVYNGEEYRKKLSSVITRLEFRIDDLQDKIDVIETGSHRTTPGASGSDISDGESYYSSESDTETYSPDTIATFENELRFSKEYLTEIQAKLDSHADKIHLIQVTKERETLEKTLNAKLHEVDEEMQIRIFGKVRF